MEIITRDEAKARGLKRYFTGKPCKHGHVALRFTSGGNCARCQEKAYWGDQTPPQKQETPPHLVQFLLSREDARAQGSSTYFEGQKCLNGHIALRYTVNSECVVCNRYKQRKTKICCRHKLGCAKERKRAQDRYYAKINADKARARAKKYAQDNKEHVSAYQAAYHSARRVLARNAQPPWANVSDLRNIYKKLKKINLEAGRNSYHVDHYYPLQGKTVCGLHVPWNLQIITAAENVAKGNKMPEEFYGPNHPPPTGENQW